jgi:predicted flap endonuclease-1-like 5' DNA nuclease/cytoskeletal protein CcmA (bactofilin family)
MLIKDVSKRLGTMLAALVVAMLLATPVAAAEPHEAIFIDDGEWIPVQGTRQVFSDDLTVESGQVIDEDVFVYSGDVRLEENSRITGDLVVLSGNVEIKEGSVVEGDVTAYSGNMSLAGEIGGDLASMSGNVDLKSTAQVGGDISVVSGSIDRAESAVVGGNVMRGPSFSFPGRPISPDAPPHSPGVSFGSSAPSFFEGVVGFIGRIFMAALLTAFAMLLVGGLFYLRPQLIVDTRKRLNEQLALSVVVGVLANFTLLILGGLLAVTICLLPLALLPMLALLAVNVVGWAVASQIVGERITSIVKQEVQPILTILIGALFLTGISALLWAIGGCLRPLAFIFVLVVSSLGTGAVLVPWINRRRNGGGTEGGSTVDVPPTPPTPSRGPVGPVPSDNESVDTDVAAPIDYFTAEEINAASEQPSMEDSQMTTGKKPERRASTSASTSPSTVNNAVEQDIDAPMDYVTAEEINAPGKKPSASSGQATSGSVPKPRTSSTSASTPAEGDVIEQDVSEPIDYVTAQEINTTDALSEGDDFLQIKGIGPAYARRLKEAGFATFAQLGAASPEEVAAAIGWPVDRVRRNEVVDQAQMLAQRS